MDNSEKNIIDLLDFDDSTTNQYNNSVLSNKLVDLIGGNNSDEETSDSDKEKKEKTDKKKKSKKNKDKKNKDKKKKDKKKKSKKTSEEETSDDSEKSSTSSKYRSLVDDIFSSSTDESGYESETSVVSTSSGGGLSSIISSAKEKAKKITSQAKDLVKKTSAKIKEKLKKKSPSSESSTGLPSKLTESSINSVVDSMSKEKMKNVLKNLLSKPENKSILEELAVTESEGGNDELIEPTIINQSNETEQTGGFTEIDNFVPRITDIALTNNNISETSVDLLNINTSDLSETSNNNLTGGSETSVLRSSSQIMTEELSSTSEDNQIAMTTTDLSSTNLIDNIKKGAETLANYISNIF